MPDHAPRPPDPLLEAVARELRRPVTLGADFEARVMRTIRAPAPPRRLSRPAWAGLALAAGITGLAVVSVLRGGDPGGPAPAGPGPVEFVLEAPAASRVALVGDFNDWDPGATPLQAGAGGRWRTSLPLAPGRYQYTFLVDGIRWTPDPHQPPSLGDDFGAPTSVITVTERATL